MSRADAGELMLGHHRPINSTFVRADLAAGGDRRLLWPPGADGPYIGSYTHVGRRVLVAWGIASREAVRALDDALPLIRRPHDEVTLMTYTPASRVWKAACSTERVVRHLAAARQMPARSGQPTWAPPYPTSCLSIIRSCRRFDRCGSLPSFPATRHLSQ